MRKVKRVVLVVALAATAGCAASVDDDPGAVPLFREHQIRRASLVGAEHSGSLLVRGADGIDRLAGVGTMISPRGEPLRIEHRMSQSAPGAALESWTEVAVADVDDDPDQITASLIDAKLSPALLAAREARIAARAAVPEPASVSAEVIARLAKAPADREAEVLIEVLVSLRDRPAMMPAAEAEAAMAGQPADPDRRRALIQYGMARYADQIRALQAPMESWLVARRGVVRERFVLGNALRVLAPVAAIRELQHHPSVARIEEDLPTAGEAVDSWETAVGTQVDQYLDNFFDGERANPSRHAFNDITLAILDQDIEDDIAAFNDVSTGVSRVASMWNCAVSPCAAAADLSAASLSSDHGTSVAAIAAGDLADGQDAAVTTVDARRRRSGLSRETRLVLIQVSDTSSVLRALDLAGGLAVDGANLSRVVGGIDCEGTSSASLAVNDMVRLTDTFFAKSAGNQGHPAGTCTVTSPGAATYAFAVGATLDADGGDANTVRTGAIYSLSSRGGGAYLSGTRSIVAMTAPSVRALVPQPDGTYASECCGTSFAAPTVLGAFADFRDWYLSTGVFAGFVNHPPNSMVAMLTMADRQREVGAAATAGYDNLWGAGRFRARMFTDAGMDAPWGWTLGSIMVSNGATSNWTLNGGAALPAGTDRLVVAIYWPEPNQASGGANGADITVDVVSTCGPAMTRSDWSFDTKKRVIFDTGVGGACWQIRLHGLSVTANPWLSSATQRVVYVAAYWEDTARDDADGPPAAIQ
jgi:hypothetical protein